MAFSGIATESSLVQPAHDCRLDVLRLEVVLAALLLIDKVLDLATENRTCTHTRPAEPGRACGRPGESTV